MNTDEIKLSAVIRGNRPKPSLPPGFQENVWRRIEDTEAPVKFSSWMDALVGMILRPRLAFAALAVLLMTGVFVGAYEGKQTAKHEAQMRYLASVSPIMTH